MGNLFILISVSLGIVGQTVMKFGVNKLGQLSFNFDSLIKAFTSFFIWTGLGFYVFGSVFWILALSRSDLSYAYPMLGFGYLVVVLVSWLFLGESVTILRILGVCFISMGLFLVFKSA